MTAIPTWFGPSDRPLFGWAHVPIDGRAAAAVVLCPPLARELAATQVCFRSLAERLAAGGRLAIRFDYDGTGDSAGDDSDPDRVESWLASIAEAVAFARRCGAGPVSLVGMRIGGPLAAVAAGRLGGIDSLVLWDPIAGRPFVRGESALRRLRFDEPPAAGALTELPGFIYRSETVAALRALTVPSPAIPPGRVLLLTRPGQNPAAELFEALGVAPELGDARGQELLLEVEPAQRQTPIETLEVVAEWLSSGATADAAISVPTQPVASVPVDGTVVTEQATWLGPVGLFAMVTEPERPSGAPSVLMLNAGTDWHVGPNRLWVELSRRWAAAGVRCVRLDESGLGDSPARPGRAQNVVRAPEAFDDVADAAEAISPGDPGNIVLLGLCSGGYQALENALVGGVRGVYAINPVLHFNPPELEWGPMDPRRRICWPASNLALTYRWLLTESVRRRLRTAIWRLVHLFNRDRGRDATNWLDELRRDKVEVLVVCGEDEARPFGAAVEPDGGSESAVDPIRIQVVSGLDGSLMPSGQRAEVTRRLTEHLLTHFAPDPTPLLSSPR